MTSPIHNLSLIQRNPTDQRIDVKSTLQVIARELISLSDNEKRIRSNRRYKAAIRRTFKKYKAQFIPMPTLVVVVLQELNVKPGDFERLHSEVEQHIRFNRGGYLRTVPGKGGGVELVKP